MTLKVSVSAEALREVLVALSGPPHLVRELQVLANSALFPDSPINVLLREFNEFAESHNKETST